MASAFVFETSNDEQHDDFQPENEEEEEAEDEDEEEQPLNKKTESLWDFAPYYESVVEEHTRKSTTSIDFKIIKALQNCTVPLIPNDDDSEFDFDKQEENDRIKDEDEESGDAVDVKLFYVPFDGASFSVNSFIELSISRPLLRACEALGYNKPTPIQVSL